MNAIAKRALSALVARAAIVLAALPVQPISAAARRSAAEPRDASDRNSDADAAARSERRARLSRAAACAERRADHRRHAAALRRHLAAGRDRDGAARATPNLAVSASNFRIAHYDIAQAKGAYDVALHSAAAIELLGQSTAELSCGRSGRTRASIPPVRSSRAARETSFSTNRRPATA